MMMSSLRGGGGSGGGARSIPKNKREPASATYAVARSSRHSSSAATDGTDGGYVTAHGSESDLGVNHTKTPRINNVAPPASPDGNGGGVAVDDLTASLLGINFLPFTPMPDGDAEHNDDAVLPQLPSLTSSPAAAAAAAAESDVDLFGDIGDNSTLTEDPADALMKRGKKRGMKKSTRIKTAFKSIKKSIRKKSSSGVGGGVGRGVLAGGRDLDEEFIRQQQEETKIGNRATAATSISSSAVGGASGEELSAELMRLQTNTNDAARRALALTDRIEAKSQEIASLEDKLASCREALAKDVSDLDALRGDIDGLQRKRKEMEQAAAATIATTTAPENARTSGAPLPPRPRAQTAPTYPPSQQKPQRPETVKRLSSFIRIHDLDLAQDAAVEVASPSGGEGGGDIEHNSSRADSSRGKSRAFSLSVEISEAQTGSTRPDLADVHGSAIAPAIVEALARMAYDAATDDSVGRWTPSPDTKKLLSKRSDLILDPVTGAAPSTWIHVPPSEVYVWHSTFDHGGYGSDLPVVKARGIVFCSAQDLVSLLLDSTRTKEYNKMSIGRTDEHYFHRNSLPGVTDEMADDNKSVADESGDDYAAIAEEGAWDGLPGETRILRSLSKPPMVKPVELLTLYHARELDSEAGQVDGYLIVSRSIWETECCVPAEGGNAGGGSKKNPSSASRTEMLLGAQLIRAVEDADRPQCELTTINHLSSKSIPMVMAKKIGLMTAASFIRDIQGVFA